MIYTAKPSQEELNTLAAFGLTRQQVIDAREHYAVHQFMMRTSARDPASNRPLVWRVWGQSCAEYLKRKVEAHYPFCVNLEHIDLGVTAKTTRRMGPKKVQTAEERKASRAKSVLKQKAKRRAARAKP